MLQKTYREQYGIKGAHLIPVNLVGEHDHFDLTNSHVIPALIRKFVDAVDSGTETVELWGSGQATREFFYAGDAAEAICLAISSGLDTDLPINLGTGKDISIQALAEQISSLCGFSGRVVYDSSKPDGQPRRQLDVTRAKKLLGFEAKTSLEEGLSKTIKWYRVNKCNTNL
jgi:GDP-L-fucose synthase